MLVGLMSTWREGQLAVNAARSALVGCDRVLVLDAPIGKQERNRLTVPTPVWELEKMGATLIDSPIGSYETDAEKRNALLREAKALRRAKLDPLWCVWIDGDEILVWGEYLSDLCGRIDEETGAGGFPLRIVEMDGSVAYSYGRVFRADRIRRFVVSSAQVETHNGMIVALPNTPICTAGGMPVKPDGGWVMDPAEQDAYLARHRPPVAGEPHILHRSLWRSPNRGLERQHEAEAREFEELSGASG